MSFDLKVLLKILEEVKKTLNKSAKFLENTGDQMINFGISLNKAENDIAKIISSFTYSPFESKLTEQKFQLTQEEIKPFQINEPEILHPPPDVKITLSDEVKSLKTEISKEKDSLIYIKNQISKLLETLKQDIIIVDEPEQEVAEIKLISEDSSLETFKAQILNIYGQFKKLMKEKEFYAMTSEEKVKALKDMENAIKILTKEYNKAEKSF